MPARAVVPLADLCYHSAQSSDLLRLRKTMIILRKVLKFPTFFGSLT